VLSEKMNPIEKMLLGQRHRIWYPRPSLKLGRPAFGPSSLAASVDRCGRHHPPSTHAHQTQHSAHMPRGYELAADKLLAAAKTAGKNPAAFVNAPPELKKCGEQHLHDLRLAVLGLGAVHA